MSRPQNNRAEIVGLLDVGSSKICCAIVERSFGATGGGTGEAGPSFRLLGMGQQRSQGVKAGMVIDLDQAEAAVRSAVGQAERMADVTLEEVLATISCGRLKSAHFSAHVDLEMGHVRPEDILKLSGGAQRFAARDGRTVVHMNRVGYLLDGEAGIREPLRLAGRRLTASFHAVTADQAPLQNLAMLIDRSYLAARQLVPSSLTSALAATTSEERQLGVTCVNIGAGVIDIAAFRDNQFLFADAIPVGGAHLTFDIARILSTPLAEAERIKTLYGTLVGARSDEYDTVSYNLAGGSDVEAYETSKAELRRILYPRVESQLEMLRERLHACDSVMRGPQSVVLTGGGSQLIGLAELAAIKLQRPVRVGGPVGVGEMPERFQGAAFSAVLGLAHVAPAIPARRDEVVPPVGSDSYLNRVERWFRESF